MIEEKKCVICHDSLIEKKELFKICNCVDSLICNDCYDILNRTKVDKCPVCKVKLNYKINKNIFSNIFIYFNHNKLLFSNILVNVILVNIIIFYKYYEHTGYPKLKYEKELELEHTIKLKDYKNYTKYLFFNKTTYFILINVCNLILYPLSYFLANLCFLNTKFQVFPYITNTNKIQLYANLSIQLINLFVLQISNNYLIYLEIYLLINLLFYSILIFVFLYTFLIVMIFENFRYIKSMYMLWSYDIKINRIYKYNEIVLDNGIELENRIVLTDDHSSISSV